MKANEDKAVLTGREVVPQSFRRQRALSAAKLYAIHQYQLKTLFLLLP